MKKAYLLAFLMTAVLCFTSCVQSDNPHSDDTSSDQTKYSNLANTYIEDMDFQYMYQREPMAEGPEAYYYRVNDFVYAIDKETLKSYPLCGKPNCLHQFEPDQRKVADCDAFFRGEIPLHSMIAYQDGYLYVTGMRDPFEFDGGSVLFRMKPDGTERKIVRELHKETSLCLIHRGYLYYVTETAGKDLKPIYQLWQAPLSGKKEPKLLFENDLVYGGIHDLSAYGNTIYFQESGYHSKEYADPVSHCLCVDLETNKVRPMLEGTRGEKAGMPMFLDDKIIFRIAGDYFLADSSGENLKRLGFLSTQDSPFIVYTDRNSIWVCSNTWVCEDGQQTILKHYDLEGNLLAEMPEPDYPKQTFFIPGSEKHFFYSAFEEQESGSEDFYLYSIDKNPSDGILCKEKCLWVDAENYNKGIVKEW